MSADELLIQIQSENKKTRSVVITCSIGGMMALFTASFVIGGKSQQFEDVKRSANRTEATVQQHEIKIAVLENVTGISKSK